MHQKYKAVKEGSHSACSLDEVEDVTKEDLEHIQDQYNSYARIILSKEYENRFKQHKYTFTVPCCYVYTIEAKTEKQAREILVKDGGIHISGELCGYKIEDLYRCRVCLGGGKVELNESKRNNRSATTMQSRVRMLWLF